MSNPLHLLILEDRPADAELMLHELRRAGFEPDWQRVETEADYLAQLHQGLDVILADYVLPQFDALRALYLLQWRGLDIPFIVISGHISEEVAVECMKQGAADYLLKDRLARLGPAVAHALQERKLRDEKRQAEAALQESEARFRRLAENAPDIIYRYSLAPSPGFEYLSPAVTAITGYTPEEYYADPGLWRKVAYPEAQRELEKLSSTRQVSPQPFVVRLVRKDGATIWTEQHNVPVYDEDGNLVAIEGIARDVTARERAEDALEESLGKVEQAKQEWESTADALPSIICLLDHRGRVIRANRTMESWNLGPVLEVKGRGLHELLHGGCTDPACYLETFWSQAWEELAQGWPAGCEAEDGVLKRHLSVQVRPILPQTDGEGKKAASFAVAIVHDVTERKRAEEQIQAALKEKEVLLKEIHHRVKNNLQVVSSLLKFQSEYVQDEQTFEMFKESQNRIRSMALIHEKLYQSGDLAKIDSGEYIRNLATHLFHSHRISLAAITLRIDVSDVSLGIDTAIPCGLIINELVSNSLKHAFPAGRARSKRNESKGEIRIALYSDKDNQFALIVSDNGIGLPGDLDFRDTESLGLQLVNMLTQQLEGTIELDRSGGTAFKITFASEEERGQCNDKCPNPGC